MELFELFKKLEKPAAPAGPVEYIIVGLGNPGREYEETRHNVGFMALDALGEKLGIRLDRLKFKSLTGEGMIAGKKVLFMKPTTFMNLSGTAVIEAMNFYKVPIERVLVIHDDVSLPIGRLRLRAKGSDGGHNGLKNIIYLTGKDNFPRIKIGVGNKPHPDYDMADWVLSRFSKEDREQIKKECEKVCEAVPLILEKGITQGMNSYNN